MTKFNIGDKVFDVVHGICTVILNDINNEWFTIERDEDKATFLRKFETSPVPLTYSIEEARKLWPDVECLKPKKVKRPIKAWMVLDTDHYRVYRSTKAAAEDCMMEDAQLIELSGEYEVIE